MRDRYHEESLGVVGAFTLFIEALETGDQRTAIGKKQIAKAVHSVREGGGGIDGQHQQHLQHAYDVHGWPRKTGCGSMARHRTLSIDALVWLPGNVKLMALSGEKLVGLLARVFFLTPPHDAEGASIP